MFCPRVRPPRGLQGLPTGGSLPQVCRPSSGGLHGVHVGGGRPCGRTTYGCLGSELPHRKVVPVCRMALGLWRSRSVVLVFFHHRAKVDTPGMSRGWASPEGTSNATPFWSRGHASVEGACCWGPPDETGCLLSYRQLISGCRRVRYPLTTDALSLSHDVRSLLPRKDSSAWPPLEEFGDVSACDQ